MQKIQLGKTVKTQEIDKSNKADFNSIKKLKLAIIEIQEVLKELGHELIFDFGTENEKQIYCNKVQKSKKEKKRVIS